MPTAFAKVYEETTNPLTPYSRLVKLDVLISILTHTVLYTIGIYAGAMLLGAKPPASVPVFFSLIAIQVMGYGMRLMRARSIFEAVGGQVSTSGEVLTPSALTRTRELMDSAYMTWYFLG